jgi:precorrin-2 dehydrogenase/sirohydrochlorin ferrochelatase
MRYYPVQLDVQDRRCLVVGGGAVGTRKVAGLLECGARVRVVSPEVDPALRELAAQEAIELHRRAYRPSDLIGMFLVIGATDDETLNRRVSRDAGKHGVLCNIADRPEICNFILPAVVRRGDLVITVSTSGSSPALAKQLRQSLEAQFGAEYADLLCLMRAIRRKLLRREHAPEVHKPLFEKLLGSGILELIRAGRTDRIDALLSDVLGEGFRFTELMREQSAGPPGESDPCKS